MYYLILPIALTSIMSNFSISTEASKSAEAVQQQRFGWVSYNNAATIAFIVFQPVLRIKKAK